MHKKVGEGLVKKIPGDDFVALTSVSEARRDMSQLHVRQHRGFRIRGGHRHRDAVGPWDAGCAKRSERSRVRELICHLKIFFHQNFENSSKIDQNSSKF